MLQIDLCNPGETCTKESKGSNEVKGNNRALTQASDLSSETMN